MSSSSSSSGTTTTPTYRVSVNQRPAFGFIGNLFGWKHQSISFEKTKGDKTKVKMVSIGNPESEPLTVYPTQVRRTVTREEYKALKESSRRHRDVYGTTRKYKFDYIGFRGNCNDHVRISHSSVGIPFPEGQDGLRNQSFRHQPPLTPQQQRRWQMIIQYHFDNPFD